MLSTLFSPLGEPNLTTDFTPNDTFFDTTSVLDLVAAFSPEAEMVLLEGISQLPTATGSLLISSGVLTGTLTTEAGDSVSKTVDVPALLTELDALLTSATGTLTLENGFVDAAFTLDDTLYTLEGFDLAVFAAAGLSFLTSELEAEIEIADGAFLINAKTVLGPVIGTINFADGDLGLDLDTPAGEIEWVFDFGPNAFYDFTIETLLGDFDALLDLDAGQLELAPDFLAAAINIPLSSLSGEALLSGGIANLLLEVDGVEAIAATIDVAELVGDAVFDTLIGLTVDAELVAGELNIAAASPDDSFTTTVDLGELNSEALDLVTSLNGEIDLDEEVASGIIAAEGTAVEFTETLTDLVDLLTGPISDLFSPPSTSSISA